MTERPDSEIELRRTIHLTRVVGEGSMGRVFDGFAADLGQYLAVKVLRPEFVQDSEMRARFENEVEVLGLIDHPGSLPIYGKGEDERGLPYYAMKKVEGRTLADLLAERGGAIHNVPSRMRLLGILLDACATVAYAHKIGIVHRDLKPSNILVDYDRSVYVIDWGIAKRLGTGSGESDSTCTESGKVMGSPGYMAPEQAEGQAGFVGPRADVFALGAMLYEILTGRRPFGGRGGREEMLATVHRDPPPPRRENWWIPRAVSEICMKALHKDPAERYADARGLVTDLRAFLEGRMNALERAREETRQHPFRTVALMLLVLLVLAVLGGFAAQLWTDRRLAGKALSRMAQLDAELTEIAAEVEGVRGKLEKPETEAEERTKLEKELHRLNSRWLLTEFEALRLLSGVAELRFVWTESEVRPLARKRLFEVIRSLIERGQPAMAGGLIETVLQRHQDGSSALGLRKEDIAQLKRLAREADQLFVEVEEGGGKESAP